MATPVLLDARNPGPLTGHGNNTFLLVGRGVTNAVAALVDAGVGRPDHLDAIDAELARHGARLSTVVVTHAHRDHASGAPDVAARHPGAVFRKYPHPADDAQRTVSWVVATEGDEIAVGDEVLTVLHTPGHAPDHIALWHESSASVFTGDLVIPGGSVMIDTSGGGSLQAYLASLERIRALGAERLYPAHGAIVEDPEAVLRAHLDHRRMREEQVMAGLRSGPTTVEAITESIYHGLAESLVRAARENVRAHLQKLRDEGRAFEHNGRWETG